MLRAALPILLLFALWEAAVVGLAIDPFYLPSIRVVAAAMQAQSGSYLDAYLVTLAEAALGFAMGGLVGVASALLFTRLPMVKDMVLPIFIVSQTVPVIAFGAIVVLWFGNTLMAKAAIAFYLTFFPVTINTLAGIAAVRTSELLTRDQSSDGSGTTWLLGQKQGGRKQVCA